MIIHFVEPSRAYQEQFFFLPLRAGCGNGMVLVKRQLQFVNSTWTLMAPVDSPYFVVQDGFKAATGSRLAQRPLLQLDQMLDQHSTLG
jgi:hypothetical protein